MTETCKGKAKKENVLQFLPQWTDDNIYYSFNTDKRISSCFSSVDQYVHIPTAVEEKPNCDVNLFKAQLPRQHDSAEDTLESVNELSVLDKITKVEMWVFACICLFLTFHH